MPPLYDASRSRTSGEHPIIRSRTTPFSSRRSAHARTDDARQAAHGRTDDARRAAHARTDDARQTAHTRTDDERQAAHTRTDDARQVEAARTHGSPPGGPIGADAYARTMSTASTT